MASEEDVTDVVTTTTAAPQQEKERDDDDDDPFLKTLAALKQAVQPPSERLQKQVRVLQRENRMLFDRLENLRQESHEELQTVQQTADGKRQEQQRQWEQTMRIEREQAQKQHSQLVSDLTTAKERLEEVEKERTLAVQAVEDDRRLLEESMIQLEKENATLREKYVTSETLSAKIEAELNERTHAYEQSKVAMAKIHGLLADAESNAAELAQCKQKMRDAQSNASDLQYKLEQVERELSTTKAKVTSMEQEATKKVAESQTELAAEQGKALEEVKERLASVNQQLDEKHKAYEALKEQRKSETTELRNKLSAKDALLEARDGMLSLVTAKTESLQKNQDKLKDELKEARKAIEDATSKHKAEMASLKEQLDEVKDELSCAEDEVKRCRKGMASVSVMHGTLEETQLQLPTAKEKMASPDGEGQRVKADMTSFEQQLDESKKAYCALQEQKQAENLSLQSKLSTKDALLEAKEKMLKLVTAKSQSLQKREAVLKQELEDAKKAELKAAAEHASKEALWKEEIDTLRDGLKFAEEELARGRKGRGEPNSSDDKEFSNKQGAASFGSTSRQAIGTEQIRESEVGGSDHLERKDEVDGGQPASDKVSARKRSAQDNDESIVTFNEKGEELDSAEARLLVDESREMSKKAKT